MNSEISTEFSTSMRLIRSVEETIAERYSEQKMRCPTHLSTGQEAVSAGLGALLRHSDLAVSGHRAHAHYLAKGGDLNAMIAEIYGKITGCSRGKGGSMHLIDESVGFVGSTAIVGGTVPVGVGLGYSLMMGETDDIACIFMGDAVVETGVFWESLNFAVLKKLPVLFICENNNYSVYTPIEARQQTTVPIHQRISGLGVKTIHGDGNDVVAVHDAAKEAIGHVRAGKGPAFLEFDTYRWREHCGPNFDDDLGYRPEEDVAKWREAEPIARFENRAIREGTLTQSEIDVVQAAITTKVEAAFEFADTSPFPPKIDATRHVLAPVMKETLL